jgi:septin family protein
MDNENKNFYCEIPFNFLICGMTDCGKTHFMLDLLEKDFNKKYD